jgi:hypothetical protein
MGFESPKVENKNRVFDEILRMKKGKITDSSNPAKTIVTL